MYVLEWSVCMSLLLPLPFISISLSFDLFDSWCQNLSHQSELTRGWVVGAEVTMSVAAICSIVLIFEKFQNHVGWNAFLSNIFIISIARKFLIVFIFQSITCIMFQASKISKETCKVLHNKHKVLLNVFNLVVTCICEQQDTTCRK